MYVVCIGYNIVEQIIAPFYYANPLFLDTLNSNATYFYDVKFELFLKKYLMFILSMRLFFSS